VFFLFFFHNAVVNPQLSNVDSSDVKSAPITGKSVCSLSSVLRFFSYVLYGLILCFLIVLTLKFGYGFQIDFLLLFCPLFGISVFFVVLMGLLSVLVCLSGNVDRFANCRRIEISNDKKVRHTEVRSVIRKCKMKISDVFVNETFLIYCIFGNPFMIIFYFSLYGAVSSSTLVINDSSVEVTDSVLDLCYKNIPFSSLLSEYLTDTFTSTHNRNMSLILILVPLFLEIMAVLYTLNEIFPMVLAASTHTKTKEQTVDENNVNRSKKYSYFSVTLVTVRLVLFIIQLLAIYVRYSSPLFPELNEFSDGGLPDIVSSMSKFTYLLHRVGLLSSFLIHFLHNLSVFLKSLPFIMFLVPVWVIYGCLFVILVRFFIICRKNYSNFFLQLCEHDLINSTLTHRNTMVSYNSLLHYFLLSIYFLAFFLHIGGVVLIAVGITGGGIVVKDGLEGNFLMSFIPSKTMKICFTAMLGYMILLIFLPLDHIAELVVISTEERAFKKKLLKEKKKKIVNKSGNNSRVDISTRFGKNNDKGDGSGRVLDCDEIFSEGGKLRKHYHVKKHNGHLHGHNRHHRCRNSVGGDLEKHTKGGDVLILYL
jgi:hypothetical protein